MSSGVDEHVSARTRPYWPSGMALLVLVVLGASCNDGYPIAATDCDEWCHWYEPPECDFSDPAGCVSLCEAEGGKPEDQQCAAQWDTAIACLKQQPPGAHCRGPSSYQVVGLDTPCRDQVANATSCRYLRENPQGTTAGNGPIPVDVNETSAGEANTTDEPPSAEDAEIARETVTQVGDAEGSGTEPAPTP